MRKKRYNSRKFLVKTKIHKLNSLVVQWLGLCASTTGDIGLIPGWGTKRDDKKNYIVKKTNICLFGDTPW